jgi:hypothetical protein
LSHLTNGLSKLEKKVDRLIIAQHVDNAEDSIFHRATTTDQVLAIEALLQDEAYRRCLHQSLNALALSVDNGREHVFSILDFIMDVQTQQHINMRAGNNVAGKTYTDHIAFKEAMPTLLALIVRVVTNKWPLLSETLVSTIMSERLRQATKRCKAASKRIA